MAITRTSMTDDDGSGTTGTILNNSWKQEFYDQIDTLFNPTTLPWTAYAPFWHSSGGTHPAIGNGALAGRYYVQGHTVHFVLGVNCQSTTTYGAAGIYSWSLPFVPSPIAGLTGFVFVPELIGPGGSGQGPLATFAFGAQEFYCVTSAGGAVGPTVPFTWQTGCALVVRGTYDI